MIATTRPPGGGFEAGGVGSFVREQGDGRGGRAPARRPVELLPVSQGDPAARREGLRAVAFDFPGLGLADRPDDFDYSWSGLARLDRRGDRRARDRALPPRRARHRRPDRLRVGDPQPRAGAVADRAQHDARRRHLPPPVVDAAVRDPGLGEIWLRTITRFAFSELFYLQGVADRAATPRHEVYAHYDLLKRERRRARVPADHAGLRAHRGEAAASSGTGSRPSARLSRRRSCGASATRRWASSGASRPAGAGRRRPDPAPRQALPPGGPGAGGRPRDRRSGRAARRATQTFGSVAFVRPARPLLQSAPLDQPRLAALGEGHLDEVEVARRVGARERLARLGEHVADVVARRDVDQREQLDARLARQLAAWRAVEWPVSTARSTSSSAKLPSCTSSSASWAASRVISHGAVSPVITTLRPARAPPSPARAEPRRRPPSTSSPRCSRPKSGPGSTPSLAAASGSKRPGRSSSTSA